MKKIIQIEGIGTITYCESFWTSSKQLYVNGTPATKAGKNDFTLNGEIFTIKGNSVTGLSMPHSSGTYQIIDKTLWYEYILAYMILVLDLIWGNSVELCAILPLVGGAIGAFICSATGVLSIYAMKLTKKHLYKVLIGLGCALASVLILYLVTLLLI